MTEVVENRCKTLINACRAVRMLLSAEIPDEEADALAMELAARGIKRADRERLTAAAGRIEQAFYEEPDPA